jgi:hypothetical protein
VYKGAAWDKLLNRMDRSSMSGDQFNDFTKDVASVAVSTGKSQAQVLMALKDVGMDIKAPDLIDFNGSSASITSGQNEAITAVLGDSAKRSNLATPGNSSALAQFASATLGGSVSATITKQAVRAMGDAKAFDAMRANMTSMMATETGRAKLAEFASGMNSIGGQVAGAEVDRQVDSAKDLARLKLGALGAGGVSAISELDAFTSSDDLLGGLTGGGEFGRAAKSGKLGEAFKIAASTDVSDKLWSSNAQSLSKTYHVDVDSIKKAQAAHDPNLQHELQLSALTGSAAKQEESASAPLREAALLKEAADILKNIAYEKNGKAVTK